MIKVSKSYHYENWCGHPLCERAYCREHRVLYRECETARVDLEGDRDVIGGLHKFYEASGKCPECRGY